MCLCFGAHPGLGPAKHRCPSPATRAVPHPGDRGTSFPPSAPVDVLDKGPELSPSLSQSTRLNREFWGCFPIFPDPSLSGSVPQTPPRERSSPPSPHPWEGPEVLRTGDVDFCRRASTKSSTNPQTRPCPAGFEGLLTQRRREIRQQTPPAMNFSCPSIAGALPSVPGQPRTKCKVGSYNRWGFLPS